MSKEKSPWATDGGIYFDVASRVEHVRYMTTDDLKRALPDAQLQKTVATAIRRELRKRSKAEEPHKVLRRVTAKIVVDPNGHMACDDIAWEERACSGEDVYKHDYSGRPPLHVQIQALLDQGRLPKGGAK